MIFLLFGPPGAGKGTQSAMLEKEKSMLHISTGDLFRNAIKNKTELGLKAKSYMDDGNLVPDEITVGLVEEVLKSLEGKDVILDGFPRTVPQADALEIILRSLGKKLDLALFIEVDQSLLLNRLTGRRVCGACGASFHIEFHPTKKEGICDKCGASEVKQRPDDKAEAIQTRLNAYQDSTYPLIDYYKTKGIYASVSGEGSAEEVFSKIVNKLAEKAC